MCSVIVPFYIHRLQTGSLSAPLKHLLIFVIYRAADKSLARPTSRCILFDGENISFDASLVIYINSTNIPPIMLINRIYETYTIIVPKKCSSFY
jgi:hypothetical protein